MKGTILDLPVTMAMMLSGAFTILIVALVLVNFQSAWTFGGEAKTVIDKGVAAFGIFDQVFIVYAVGLGLFSVISAFYVNSHPVAYIFSMVMLGIVVMVSAMVSNAFDIFANNLALAPVIGDYTYIVLLMRNLPLFFLVLGLMIAVAMHGKPETNPSGGSGY